MSLILSPCISMLFSGEELTFTEKIRTVHKLGYTAYEFWDGAALDLDEVESVQNELGIKAATFLTKPVPLTHPDYRREYVEGIKQCIAIAQRLGCPNLLTVTGWQTFDDIPRDLQYQSVVAGLKAAAPYLEEAGMTATLEPLNHLIDHPGYFLNFSQEAFAIIDEVNSPNIKVLFDIYHQQITEGNLIPNITDNIDKIGHFHVADHPGRHQPGTGKINYHNVLQAIKQAGYHGYIGLEYKPTIDPRQSLQQISEEFSFLSV